MLNINIRTVIDVAHNDYLNIWVNQGGFALVAYLLLLGTAGYRWIKNGGDDMCVAISGSAILCGGIQLTFGMSSYIVAPFFWILLAYCTPKK